MLSATTLFSIVTSQEAQLPGLKWAMHKKRAMQKVMQKSYVKGGKKAPRLYVPLIT